MDILYFYLSASQISLPAIYLVSVQVPLLHTSPSIHTITTSRKETQKIMATTLKALRAIRAPVKALTHRHYTTGTFKDPWSYPASARESSQSFREAKVEFTKDPLAKNDAAPIARTSPKVAASRNPTPASKGDPQNYASKIKLPDPGTLEAARRIASDNAWETERYSCPFTFMPYLDERKVEDGLRALMPTKDGPESESGGRGGVKENSHGGKPLIWV